MYQFTGIQHGWDKEGLKEGMEWIRGHGIDKIAGGVGRCGGLVLLPGFKEALCREIETCGDDRSGVYRVLCRIESRNAVNLLPTLPLDIAADATTPSLHQAAALQLVEHVSTMGSAPLFYQRSHFAPNLVSKTFSPEISPATFHLCLTSLSTIASIPSRPGWRILRAVEDTGDELRAAAVLLNVVLDSVDLSSELGLARSRRRGRPYPGLPWRWSLWRHVEGGALEVLARVIRNGMDACDDETAIWVVAGLQGVWEQGERALGPFHSLLQQADQVQVGAGEGGEEGEMAVMRVCLDWVERVMRQGGRGRVAGLRWMSRVLAGVALKRPRGGHRMRRRAPAPSPPTAPIAAHRLLPHYQAALNDDTMPHDALQSTLQPLSTILLAHPPEGDEGAGFGEQVCRLATSHTPPILPAITLSLSHPLPPDLYTILATLHLPPQTFPPSFATHAISSLLPHHPTILGQLLRRANCKPDALLATSIRDNGPSHATAVLDTITAWEWEGGKGGRGGGGGGEEEELEEELEEEELMEEEWVEEEGEVEGGRGRRGAGWEASVESAMGAAGGDGVKAMEVAMKIAQYGLPLPDALFEQCREVARMEDGERSQFALAAALFHDPSLEVSIEVGRKMVTPTPAGAMVLMGLCEKHHLLDELSQELDWTAWSSVMMEGGSAQEMRGYIRGAISLCHGKNAVHGGRCNIPEELVEPLIKVLEGVGRGLEVDILRADALSLLEEVAIHLSPESPSYHHVPRLFTALSKTLFHRGTSPRKIIDGFIPDIGIAIFARASALQDDAFAALSRWLREDGDGGEGEGEGGGLLYSLATCRAACEGVLERKELGSVNALVSCGLPLGTLVRAAAQVACEDILNAGVFGAVLSKVVEDEGIVEDIVAAMETVKEAIESEQESRHQAGAATLAMLSGFGLYDLADGEGVVARATEAALRAAGARIRHCSPTSLPLLAEAVAFDHSRFRFVEFGGDALDGYVFEDEHWDETSCLIYAAYGNLPRLNEALRHAPTPWTRDQLAFLLSTVEDDAALELDRETLLQTAREIGNQSGALRLLIHTNNIQADEIAQIRDEFAEMELEGEE